MKRTKDNFVPRSPSTGHKGHQPPSEAETRHHVREVSQWLLTIPVIIFILFCCAHVSLITTFRLPILDVGSSLSVEYAPWNYLSMLALRPNLIQEIKRDYQIESKSDDIFKDPQGVEVSWIVEEKATEITLEPPTHTASNSEGTQTPIPPELTSTTSSSPPGTEAPFTTATSSATPTPTADDASNMTYTPVPTSTWFSKVTATHTTTPTATDRALPSATATPTPTDTPVPTSTSPPPGDPWYNCSWAYRKQITIHASQGSGNHTNFPVLISL